MNNTKYHITTLIITLISCFAQAQDAKELLRSYFNEVQSGKNPSIPLQFSSPEYANKTLNAITPYENDTSATVRSKAYAIVQLVGKSNQSDVREAVQHLVQACKDKDSGNVGAAISYLTTFYKKDFNNASQDEIRNIFKQNPPHFDQLLRLIGFLELNDLQESIKPYLQPGNSRSNRWAAIVALARMGDSFAIQDMLTRAKKLPVNDDIVYEIFPDLIYTKQEPALDYVIEVLRSDDKNCTSPGESEAPIVCGYRIMEQLANVIEGYPLQLDESGDLKTTDYKQALITIRTWFDTHKEYMILKSTY